MRTLTALCWSLAIVSAAWVGMRAVDKGVTIKLVHMLTTPAELAELSRTNKVEVRK